jgi:hypothetical protein
MTNEIFDSETDTYVLLDTGNVWGVMPFDLMPRTAGHIKSGVHYDNLPNICDRKPSSRRFLGSFLKSFIRNLTFVFASGMVFTDGAGHARAQSTPEQTEASVTYLGGGASALVYWVDRADGRHVVTTVDTALADAGGSGEDKHAIVRFTTILLPGQAQSVSVPTPGTVEPQELRISYVDDRIYLALVSLAPAIAETAHAK